jgi:perosamine synthetase
MIPHNKPTLGLEEQDAAKRVIESGWLVSGPETKAFENEFCRFLGLSNNHAVAVSNGTSALFLALNAINARKKKISIPTYSCSALRNAVKMAGGHEEILDISKHSPNANFSKKTDISIVTHMFGIPIDTSNFKGTVIEDCCQALGAKIDQTFVGLQGNLGIFSFYASKLLTTGGQGGMIVSKNKNLIKSIKDFLEFDLRNDQKIRFNFQFTDLQAAIGREQLKKLPMFLKKREKIFQKYKKSGFDLIDIDKKDKNHLYPVRYRAVLLTNKPKSVIKSLEKSGVKSIVPIMDWELLGFKSNFPNALELSKKTVSLPIYPSLTDEEIEIIIKAANV